MPKQLLYVNSNNRITGTHTNFDIKLDIDPSQKFNNVVCLDAAIPKSFYIISSANNTFTLTENGTPYTVTLSVGNYTRKSLSTELTTQLNAAGSYTYATSYDIINTTADTGKYTFSVTGNSSNQPTFTFPNSRLSQVIGFERSSSYTFSADSLTAINVCNLSQETNILIRSDICQNYTDNILQPINSSGNSSFSTIVFQNPAPEYYSRRYNGSSDNVFNFTITSELDNDVLETNGLNIVMTLALF